MYIDVTLILAAEDFPVWMGFGCGGFAKSGLFFGRDLVWSKLFFMNEKLNIVPDTFNSPRIKYAD